MLTNFFGKSKPINFFLCAFLLLIALLGGIYVSNSGAIISMEVLVKTGLFLLLVFSMLLLDFIIRKNSLTQTNTFAVFLFVCFIAMVPNIFSETNIVISSVFVLLAVRRIVSLGSELNIEKKILDAAFYITIASLFHFWCILFLLPLYWAVIKISTQSFRLFFIPIVGVVTVLILACTYHLVYSDTIAWFYDWISFSSFNFAAYNELALLIPSAVMGTLFLWVFVVRLLKASSMPRKLQTNYKLITVILMLSIVVSAFSPVKSGAELLFIMAPLAVATTNYMERVNDFWFQEMVLWVVALLPFGMFFL